MSATVHGRVQGVGFRYAAQAEARRCGLAGWVCNLDNGDVEVYARGKQEALTRFLDWLRCGPPWARVDSVTAAWPRTPPDAPSSAGQSSFVIR